MFDTMTLTKIVGGFCGSFLVFLLGGFVGEFIYHEAESHGDEHHQAYTIDTGAEEDADDEEMVEVAFADVYASADASAGEALFRQCKACHKVEDGGKGTGPHLFQIVGRDIAAVADYNYSSGFDELADIWSPEALSGFLEDPKGFAPGTKMTYKGMPSVEDRANLIAWLESLDG